MPITKLHWPGYRYHDPGVPILTLEDRLRLLPDLQRGKLNPDQFFRINRSELVHVEYIEKAENYFNDRLAISVSGQKEALITSTARTAAFRHWLQQL